MEERLKRQLEKGAGMGTIQGAQAIAGTANRVMDKRVVQSVLYQKASELRGQAEGLERLAELVGAAANHDMTLLSAVLTLIDHR
jgi:hypothetical protein